MKFYSLAVLLFIFFNSQSQSTESLLRSDIPVPRGEMRAAWVTSVSNLDWPRPGDRGNPEAQKASLIEYLDLLEYLNMNAAFLQVRTEGDAFYNSPYEPWSRFLGGAQGTDPGYDPIQFAIEEAHKRGIELHAWLNPYRLNSNKNAGDSYYHETHIYKEHPEWALEYSDGGKILNPGLPEVQEYLKIIVGDLINKYDLDGIHFDDYFYAYGGTPTSMDQDTYNTYGAEYATIGDFRRGSINKMIANVWDTIQSVRPYIRFGVSPFGIYGNGMNPDGISGLDAYNTIYCDPLAWLEEGTVDYITPQLYWTTGGAQDYGTLLPWWANWVNTYNRHLYPGHGTYRIPADGPVSRISDFSSDLHEYKEYFNLDDPGAKTQADAWTLNQLVKQIEITRQSAHLGALGGVHFRIDFFNIITGLKEYIKEEAYFNKVLFPEMTWKSSETPVAPANLRLEQADGEAFFSLAWDHPKDSIRYVIYTFSPDETEEARISDDNRLALTYDKSLNLSIYDIPIGNRMVVTALNRYGVESLPSAVFEAEPPASVVLINPIDDQINVTSAAELSWHSANFASTYRLEVSFDEAFTSILSFDMEDTAVAITDLQLEGETTYFWRVAGMNIGGQGEYSSTFSFTAGYPSNVALLTPEKGETNVSLQPEFTWEATTGSESIHIQVSQGGSAFSTSSLVIDDTVENTGSYTPAEPLQTLYTHYVRIRGSNEFGTSYWTPITQFKTLMPTPEAPLVISPENNASDLEAPVTIAWQPSEGATSYVVQLTDDKEFNNILIDQAIYGSTEYTINTLELGTQYWTRVSARNAGGLGNWSEAVTFLTADPVTGIEFPENLIPVLYPNPGSGKVYLRGLDYENTTIKITDALGREVKTKSTVQVSEKEILIDLEGAPCTPCIIRIQSEDGKVEVFKFFIEK